MGMGVHTGMHDAYTMHMGKAGACTILAPLAETLGSSS